MIDRFVLRSSSVMLSSSLMERMYFSKVSSYLYWLSNQLSLDAWSDKEAVHIPGILDGKFISRMFFSVRPQAIA